MSHNPNQNQSDKNQANRQQGGQGAAQNPNKQHQAQTDPNKRQQGGHQGDNRGGQQPKVTRAKAASTARANRAAASSTASRKFRGHQRARSLAQTAV